MSRTAKYPIIVALATLVFSANLSAQASATQPDVLVKETTSKIIRLIASKKQWYSQDKNRLYAMVDEHILPHFDFRKMSQYVLGLSWRHASEEQRTRFTSAFRKMLVRTYATALLKYDGQQIVFLPYDGKEDAKIVRVKTKIHQPKGGDDIPLYYTFYNQRPGWKIFDLTVEGVSLVANYRKVYASRIQKEGLDGVIKYLESLNEKAEQAGSAS